jgi:hypothetical protein
MQTSRSLTCTVLTVFFALTVVQNTPLRAATVPKTHIVTFGFVRKVPYTPVTSSAEPSLKIRPLLIDGHQREWTLGEPHDITDRSFTIRRALRINDALPTDSAAHWVWQPGPWLLVDRGTGHITALHLPDFDPAVSTVVWFRDYAAYCGVASSTRGGLFALVAQLTGTSAARRVAQKQIGKWPIPDAPDPPCAPANWQRSPLRATLQPANAPLITFDITGTSSLVEEGDNDGPDPAP